MDDRDALKPTRPAAPRRTAARRDRAAELTGVDRAVARLAWLRWAPPGWQSLLDARPMVERPEERS